MSKDNSLAFLVYVSRESKTMSAERLAALLAKSRRANQRRHITGMLLYRDGSFMQVLEGAKSEISNLFERIAKDSRHRQVDLLILEAADKRYFADWSMGFCDLARPQDKELAGYSAFLRQGLYATNAPLAHGIPNVFLKVFAGNPVAV